MKTILLILGLLGISASVFSQKNKIPRNGKVKVYYPSESKEKVLKETGLNKEDSHIGIWNFYTSDGKLDYTIDYQGKKSLKKVYIGETVIAEEYFSNDTLDGIQTYYNSIGEKNFIYYYTLGQPDSMLRYDPKTGVVLARYHYYPNLNMSSCQEYFPSGALKSVQAYDKNGKKDGVWYIYELNEGDGTIYLREKATYKQGKLNGNLSYGIQNCTLQDYYYKDDVKHGISREYYPDCQLKYTVEYQEGHKIGKGNMYFRNGSINQREYWSRQDPNQPSICDSIFTYREDGTTKSFCYQKRINNKDIESRYIVFYPNGKIQEQYTTVNGIKNGILKSYYENGIPQTEIPYTFYRINGKMTFWYSTGKKKLELIVEDDVVESQKGWDQAGKLIPFEDERYRPLYESEDFYGLLNYMDDAAENYRNTKSHAASDEFVQEGSSYRASEPRISYEKYAKFPGGESNIHSLINQFKRYPEAEKTFKKSSIIVNLNFFVEADGSVSELKVNVYGPRKEAELLFETEMKRVFTHLPLWSPAVSNGKNTRQKQSFSVQF